MNQQKIRFKEKNKEKAVDNVKDKKEEHSPPVLDGGYHYNVRIKIYNIYTHLYISVYSINSYEDSWSTLFSVGFIGQEAERRRRE